MFGWDDFGNDGKRGGEEKRKMEGPNYFLSRPTKT